MSNINPNNIDGTYPVAGQDNDSQGFRDNFTNIKNNFTFAKGELEDLASKAILKSALVGGVLNNDMAGSIIKNAGIQGFREPRIDHQSLAGDYTLNFADSHYHKFTTTGNVLLTVTGWPPSGSYSKFRIEMDIADPAHTVSFVVPSGGQIRAAGVQGFSNTDNTLYFQTAGKHLYELCTDDAGSFMALNDLSRNRASFVGVLSQDAITSSATLGDTGLSFKAVPGKHYSFEAIVPFSHSAASTSTHSFAVGFTAGTIVATISQQASPTSGFSDTTVVASNTAGTVTTTSASVKMAKVSGTYYNNTTAPVQVALRFATNSGSLTVKAGASLVFTQLD